jgi:hypothetical protein
MREDADLDVDLDVGLDVDLDVDLDNYLLHPQPQRSLRIVHAFMDDHVIEHVCEETVATEDGVLRQEQLIWCIKRQQQRQRALRHAHFKLRAMFLYNMDLEPDEIRDFCAHSRPHPHPHPHPQFITPVSAVEDVAVRSAIPMFASLNALYIMYEASTPGQQLNQSKKRVVIQHKKGKGTRRTRGDYALGD